MHFYWSGPYLFPCFVLYQFKVMICLFLKFNYSHRFGIQCFPNFLFFSQFRCLQNQSCWRMGFLSRYRLHLTQTSLSPVILDIFQISDQLFVVCLGHRFRNLFGSLLSLSQVLYQFEYLLVVSTTFCFSACDAKSWK